MYGRSLNVSPQDRAKYFEERMSWEASISSGFMRSSYAWLIPPLMDTASNLTEGKPFFKSTGRATGMGVGLLKGTVPYSVIESLGSLFEEGTRSVYSNVTGRGTEVVSKRDLRNLIRQFWITQLPGVNQLLNYAVSDSSLPETDKRRN